MDNLSQYTLVVIDDEEGIRNLLQKGLAQLGYKVISIENAEDFLYMIKENETKVDLIITDIKLRKMDGIELLRNINMLDEPIPVLIITGQGGIEDAIKALRYGASDYVRKPFDIKELASIVKDILRRKQEALISDELGKYLINQKMTICIPVDHTICNVVSYMLIENLTPMGLCNRTTSENIALSIREALENAMFHGNLEISSEVVQENGIRAFYEEVEKRKKDERYKDRKVTISQELTKDFVEYIIEDEGPGFDYNSLPDPRNPDNFFKYTGRGILIMNIHMDEIDWNKEGNIIRLRKYKVTR